MALFHTRKKFLRAVTDGDAALVREYLSQDTGRNAEWLGPIGDHDTTALHIAAESRRLEIMEILIDAGANINAVNRRGHTPLHMAMRHNSPDAARLLIARGASVNMPDNDGLAPFGHAVYHQKTENVRLMLDNGAEINDGKSFLRACMNRDVQTIALLVERGANTHVTQSGQNNQTPAHILAGNGCAEGFKILVAANGIADLNARLNNDGNTPLHLAATQGHIGMIEALLAAGARPDVENNDGLTPDAAAMKKDKHQAAKILRKKRERGLMMAQSGETWARIGTHMMAHVVTAPAFDRRLTEIFNFESRERIVISENLKTGAETTLPPASFDTIDSAAIDSAAAEFRRHGGDPGEEMPGKSAARKGLTPRSSQN